MNDLGIQSMDMTDEDYAALGAAPEPAAESEAEASYLDELERLATLRDQGIITDADFEAKKAQLLGL